LGIGDIGSNYPKTEQYRLDLCLYVFECRAFVLTFASNSRSIGLPRRKTVSFTIYCR